MCPQSKYLYTMKIDTYAMAYLTQDIFLYTSYMSWVEEYTQASLPQL